MRFLLDQDVYGSTAHFLASLEHDVVRVSQIGHAQATDEQLLLLAKELRRIFVTRDRDYGSLVFLGNHSTGLIYLRILPAAQEAVHRELQRVLESYSEKDLQAAFIVVEPGRHRFRRLPD